MECCQGHRQRESVIQITRANLGSDGNIVNSASFIALQCSKTHPQPFSLRHYKRGIEFQTLSRFPAGLGAALPAVSCERKAFPSASVRA